MSLGSRANWCSIASRLSESADARQPAEGPRRYFDRLPTEQAHSNRGRQRGCQQGDHDQLPDQAVPQRESRQVRRANCDPGPYSARRKVRSTQRSSYNKPCCQRASSLTTRAHSTSPSPLDRILATDFAAACVDFVESQTTKRDPAYAKLGASFLLACLPACLPAHVDIGVTCAHRVPPVSACVGMVDGSIKFTPFEEAVKQMDHVHRRPVKQQWMPVWSLFRSDIAVSLSLSLICSLLVQILNLVSVLGKPGPTWYMAEHVGRLRKKDGTSGNRVSCLVHT